MAGMSILASKAYAFFLSVDVFLQLCKQYCYQERNEVLINKLLLDVFQYAQVCLIRVFQCSAQHAAFSVVQQYICNNGKGSYQK